MKASRGNFVNGPGMLRRAEDQEVRSPRKGALSPEVLLQAGRGILPGEEVAVRPFSACSAPSAVNKPSQCGCTNPAEAIGVRFGLQPLISRRRQNDVIRV